MPPQQPSEDGQRGILGERTSDNSFLAWAAGDGTFSWCVEEEVNGIQMKFIDMKMRRGTSITQVQEITCRLSISRSILAYFTHLVNTKLDLILEYKMDAK